MPKPLSHYKLGDEHHSSFDPEECSGHPLFQYVNLVISRSAICDILWNCMAARFLKADFEVAYEMLQALNAEGARVQIIRAAARKVLSDPDFELYAAVWKAAKPLRDQRHKFAHHLFGLNSGLPNALLLIDSRIVGRGIFLDPDAGKPARPGRLGHKLTDGADEQIEAYEVADLRDIALMATITEYMVASLLQALGPPGERRDGGYQWLFEHPQSPLCIDSPTQRTKPVVRPEWPAKVHPPGEPVPDPPIFLWGRVRRP